MHGQKVICLEGRLFSANQIYLKRFQQPLIGWKKSALSKIVAFLDINTGYMSKN